MIVVPLSTPIRPLRGHLPPRFREGEGIFYREMWGPSAPTPPGWIIYSFGGSAPVPPDRSSMLSASHRRAFLPVPAGNAPPPFAARGRNAAENPASRPVCRRSPRTPGESNIPSGANIPVSPGGSNTLPIGKQPQTKQNTGQATRTCLVLCFVSKSLKRGRGEGLSSESPSLASPRVSRLRAMPPHPWVPAIAYSV